MMDDRPLWALDDVTSSGTTITATAVIIIMAITAVMGT